MCSASDQGRIFIFLAGLFFGIAAMVRPGMVYLLVVIVAVWLIANLKSHKIAWHPGVFLLTVALCLSLWLVRN